MTILSTNQYVELFNRIAPKLAAMNFKKIDHYYYTDSRYHFIKDLELDVTKDMELHKDEDLVSYDTALPRQRGFLASRLIRDRPRVWLKGRLTDSGAEAYWVFDLYGYPGAELEKDPQDPNGYTLPQLRCTVEDIHEEYLDKVPEYADKILPKYEL